jgi:pimeloyl-ACP methyl ester carboxylesterase
MTRSHIIAGGGGVKLHVAETGKLSGRPILFIHGFSQSRLAWTRQLDSALADEFRLLAMDLRGHGLSEKPREGYTDAKLWADDVHAVIRRLELDRPVLCGWSYGPLVILDYIRHYGEDAIAGAVFVGGVTKLGSEEATSVLTPEFLALVPGFFSTEAEESVRALDTLISLCFAPELSYEDRHLMLGCSVSVPPYVRQGMFSRAFDNDDLLPTLGKPVLAAHATRDAVVSPAVIERQLARIPRRQVRMFDSGHACFWDSAPAFNQCLQDFAGSL